MKNIENAILNTLPEQNKYQNAQMEKFRKEQFQQDNNNENSEMKNDYDESEEPYEQSSSQIY